MPTPAATLILLLAAFPTAVLGGIVGFGTGLTMLPLVVWTVGVRASVPAAWRRRSRRMGKSVKTRSRSAATPAPSVRA